MRLETFAPPVSAITAEDLSRIPAAAQGPETSGPEAARAAAENGAPSSAEPPGADPSSSAPPPPSGAAAVLFVDMVLALGVQLAAQRAKVPFRECAALAKLTADERALLEQFAPYAAPYLGAVGETSPIVGALAFAGVTAMVLAGRFRDVRALAPPASSAKPSSSSSSPSWGGERSAWSSSVSPAPPPPGARVVDLDHVSKWGTLVDVVEPGTEVRDSGKFPEPEPSS